MKVTRVVVHVDPAREHHPCCQSPQLKFLASIETKNTTRKIKPSFNTNDARASAVVYNGSFIRGLKNAVEYYR